MKLYEFQKEFVHWYNDPSKTNKAAFNASEPGLGKSVMTLAAIFFENKKPNLIILCPKNAIAVWKHHLKLFGYEGDIRLTFSPGEGACISTYESIAPLEEEALDKRPLEDFKKEIQDNTIIIADEFHQCKNSKAKKTLRFKKLFTLIKQKEGKCIALTGTPIMNRPMELKTLLENVDLFKKSFGNAVNFYNLFGGHFNLFLKRLVWDSSKRDPQKIKECLKNVLFIKKKQDVISVLPSVIDQKIYVDINKKHKKELDELHDKYKDSDLLKLQKTDFTKYSRVRESLSIEKYKHALETIEFFEEIDKPILVFSDFVIPIEALAKRPGWRGITGAVSESKRDQYATEFNSGKLKGLAVTIKAGSTALSLTGTDTVVFIDMNLVPGLNVQAKKRIDRVNKPNLKLNYIYFIANHPFEESISKILQEKEKLVQESY